VLVSSTYTWTGSCGIEEVTFPASDHKPISCTLSFTAQGHVGDAEPASRDQGVADDVLRLTRAHELELGALQDELERERGLRDELEKAHKREVGGLLAELEECKKEIGAAREKRNGCLRFNMELSSNRTLRLTTRSDDPNDPHMDAQFRTMHRGSTIAAGTSLAYPGRARFKCGYEDYLAVIYKGYCGYVPAVSVVDNTVQSDVDLVCSLALPLTPDSRKRIPKGSRVSFSTLSTQERRPFQCVVTRRFELGFVRKEYIITPYWSADVKCEELRDACVP
jgi:hypothetical protein